MVNVCKNHIKKKPDIYSHDLYFIYPFDIRQNYSYVQNKTLKANNI